MAKIRGQSMEIDTSQVESLADYIHREFGVPDCSYCVHQEDCPIRQLLDQPNLEEAFELFGCSRFEREKDLEAV